MEVIYWNEKVEKFINNLDRVTSSRVRNTIYLLEEHGNLLDMPDSKSLGKGMFELRTQGKIKVRILYIFCKSRAYLVHGFIKKASKINTKDIIYAGRIQREVINLA